MWSNQAPLSLSQTDQLHPWFMKHIWVGEGKTVISFPPHSLAIWPCETKLRRQNAFLCTWWWRYRNRDKTECMTFLIKFSTLVCCFWVITMFMTDLNLQGTEGSISSLGKVKVCNILPAVHKPYSPLSQEVVLVIGCLSVLFLQTQHNQDLIWVFRH